MKESFHRTLPLVKAVIVTLESSSPRDAGARRGGASLDVPPLPDPLLHPMEERAFRCFRLRLAALLSHCTFLSVPICFLLLVAPVLRGQSDSDGDALPMLVHVLRGTADPELQRDILRGLSAAFKGRRQVP